MSKKWIRLIELRKAAGLTQYDLAQKLKLSRSTLGNYEVGDREPDFETTQRVADFFGVSLDYLLGRDPLNDQGETTEVPKAWQHLIQNARMQGFSLEEVTQALQLLATVRKQQEALQKEEKRVD